MPPRPRFTHAKPASSSRRRGRALEARHVRRCDPMRVARWSAALGAVALLATFVSRAAQAQAQETVEVAARPMADGAALTLVRDAAGDGHLARRDAGASAAVPIQCER
ncbi:MAG: hypothetical protein IT190_07730, partial [Microbacteriaceae bacterium]|nr:hypothetical protein [Microbacteriaceae bacterium]